MRWVLHVDLDQFIAAVEVLRRPELRGKPVIVGGDGDPAKRGVVSTATYEAREFGVHSGMALRTAARRCPDAVFLPVDKETYEAVSIEVMETLRSFPVVVEVLGWDEAFVEAHTDDPESMAGDIRTAIRTRTALESSIGIGGNPLQAKLATGFAKPAGVFRLTDENWYDVLGDLAPDALWGIGGKTAKKLADLDITTVRRLARADPDVLAKRFGPTMGPWYILVARGRDNSEVESTPWVARSRGHEKTFQRNLEDWSEVEHEVERLARAVADEVKREGRPAARVVVKIRYAPFVTRTHGHTFGTPTADAEALVAAARTALDDLDTGRAVRLLGVRAEFPRSEES